MVTCSRMTVCDPMSRLLLLAVIFLVLRELADGGEGKDWQASPIVVRPTDRDMGLEHDAVAELHLRSDDAERADLDSGAEFSTRIDHGGRMNVGHARNFELWSRCRRRCRR